ncbi:hypothetical protein QS257_05390 [Terrilactibacillus sp. S3-3]|nr:hypothetical protein QS257_05390 [Terrilactibacillus sp. S3-3]
MERQILPPEPLTNEAIASRLTDDAIRNIDRGLIKKKNLVI